MHTRDVGVEEEDEDEDEFPAASRDGKSGERDASVLHNTHAHVHAHRYTHAHTYSICLLLIFKWHVKRRAEAARWDVSFIRFTHVSLLVIIMKKIK